MLNMNQIANTLTNMMNMNPNQKQGLNQAIEKAREMMNAVQNPQEALKKANVNPSFLKTIRSYINNPMYAFILPMIGIDKQTALQKIDEVERMLTEGPVNPTSSIPSSSISSVKGGQTDDLDRFKRGLNSFK